MTTTPSPAVLAMRDEALAAQLVAARTALDAKVLALALLRKETLLLSAEVERLNEERIRRLIPQIGPRDWAFLLHVGDPESRTKHTALTATLARGISPERYSSFGATVAGAASATELGPRQYTLKVGLVRGVPELTLSVLELLTEISPVLILHTPRAARNDDVRPYKYIGLFEHTLSASGSYFLAINESLGLFELRKSSHGFETMLRRTSGLKELLDHVEDRYFYQLASGVDETGDQDA